VGAFKRSLGADTLQFMGKLPFGTIESKPRHSVLRLRVTKANTEAKENGGHSKNDQNTRNAVQQST
jgi:hypothetical protein